MQTLKQKLVHKNDSVRNPKNLGLHALWRQYPYDYWVIQSRNAIVSNAVDARMDERGRGETDRHTEAFLRHGKQLKQTSPTRMWQATLMPYGPFWAASKTTVKGLAHA